MTVRRGAVVLAALGLLAGACGGTSHSASTSTSTTAASTTSGSASVSSTTGAPAGGASTTSAASTTGASTTGTPATTARVALAALHLGTTTVATLDQPIALATRAGTNDLYVAEKTGRVRRITVTTAADGSPAYHLEAPAVLDLSKQVATDGERGLLGLTFSTDGRQLYVFAMIAADGRSSVAAYTMAGTTADPASRRELLAIPRRYANHNGGELAIGPDGYLYIGVGDGGSEDDPDHHGQDTSTLFAKVLRIDPNAGGGKAYGIPPGNPFASGGGRPEIWLYGGAHPWRLRFDRANGDLWVGDVGQDTWEEVDRLPATGGRDAGRGANLGWSRMEATHPFQGGTNPPGGVLPVYEYSHAHGCSITGGYVYRGSAIAGLHGAYLFADYCEGGLRAIVATGGHVTDSRTFDLPLDQVQSFGQDSSGEVYALLAGGPVLRLVSAG